MRIPKLTAALAGATVFVAIAAPLSGAHAVSITNGSFEAGNYIDDGGSGYDELANGSPDITGWTVGGGAAATIDWIDTYWTAQDGHRSIDLNGITAGSLSQTITGLSSGQTYAVTFYLAGNPDSGPTDKTLDVMASVDSQSYTFLNATSHSRSDMGWTIETFSFVANDTSATLTFASTVTTGGGNGFPAAFGPAIDNVSISPSSGGGRETPLPAALPLFASGLGAIGVLGWRRRRMSA